LTCVGRRRGRGRLGNLRSSSGTIPLWKTGTGRGGSIGKLPSSRAPALAFSFPIDASSSSAWCECDHTRGPGRFEISRGRLVALVGSWTHGVSRSGRGNFYPPAWSFWCRGEKSLTERCRVVLLRASAAAPVIFTFEHSQFEHSQGLFAFMEFNPTGIIDV
jgi:hypothetical protein